MLIVFVITVLVTYWLYFLFPFLSGMIWMLCEKTWVFLFLELLLSIMNFFFSKYLYIFVRVSVILIQKKWEIERQLRYVSMLNLSFDLCKKSYYLILLVLRWIILYLILENDLLFSRNQVFCFKKWKLVEALIQVEFIIFLWNFAHVFS